MATTTPIHPALRNDTMLGVCQAIGDEIGISPTWLRLAFALSMFFLPAQTVLVYLALALVVGATYWRWPLQAAGEATAPAMIATSTAADNDPTEIARAA